MRFPRLVLVVLAGVGAALPAHAQNSVSVGTMTMVLEKIKPNADPEVMNTMEELEFFNDANCRCDAKFGVRMELTGNTGSLLNQTVQIWVGHGCSTPTTDTDREKQCVRVSDQEHKLIDFINKTVHLQIPASLFMKTNPTADACAGNTGSASVFAAIDVNGDGTWDTGGIWQMTDATNMSTISFDDQAPTVVSEASATGIEGGFKVTWKASTDTDLRGAQVLCQWSKTGGPVFKSPPHSAEYRRTSDVTFGDGSKCMVSPTTASVDAGVAVDGGTVPDAAIGDDGGAAAAVAAVVADDSTVDAGTVGSFDELDPAFVCTDLQGGNSDAAFIDISDANNLTPHTDEDGIIAKIVVIDNARNYSVTDVGDSGPPVPAVDAWEYYHQQGGHADGGYCFVATAAYGDYDHPYVKVLRRFRDETLATFGWGRGVIAWYYAHSPPWADFLRAHPVARAAAAMALFPVVVLAAIWNELGPAGLIALALGLWMLARWRRRRRLVAAAATAALLVVLLGGNVARAQAWLDEEEMRTEHKGPAISHWLFEIKVGPYFPHIDDESGVTGNPYATVFGSGSSILPQIELDYYPLHLFGELGIGLSAGYMSNGAKAFVQNPDGSTKLDENGNPVRGQDDTSFTMFPLALMAVYRLTELADRTVVPIVPYAKLGLSYYIWRFTKTQGKLSSVDGNDGAGGTLGWQGTIGVSVRAEQLDPDAARAASADLGVDHISFFFELTFAQVSGLGASNKLQVGDTTWSAGLNFEF